MKRIFGILLIIFLVAGVVFFLRQDASVVPQDMDFPETFESLFGRLKTSLQDHDRQSFENKIIAMGDDATAGLKDAVVAGEDLGCDLLARINTQKSLESLHQAYEDVDVPGMKKKLIQYIAVTGPANLRQRLLTRMRVNNRADELKESLDDALVLVSEKADLLKLKTIDPALALRLEHKVKNEEMIAELTSWDEDQAEDLEKIEAVATANTHDPVIRLVAMNKLKSAEALDSLVLIAKETPQEGSEYLQATAVQMIHDVDSEKSNQVLDDLMSHGSPLVRQTIKSLRKGNN